MQRLLWITLPAAWAAMCGTVAAEPPAPPALHEPHLETTPREAATEVAEHILPDLFIDEKPLSVEWRYHLEGLELEVEVTLEWRL